MKAKIIHTKEFHCADDHPIVYYVVDENNEGVCEYCSAKFRYEEKKEDWWDRHKSYIEHRKTYPYGRPPKIKDERTPSEKMQDELEPIPHNYVNKILKGSG